MNNSRMKQTMKVFLSLFTGLGLVAVMFAAPGEVKAAYPTCTVGSSGDFTTIAAAIADTNCQTISIEAGVYYEQLSINRALTIEKTVRPFGNVFIDGSGSGRVISIGSNGDVSISNIYIMHGNSGLGGGIRNQGTLRLSRTTVRDNTAPASNGGGIYNQNILVINNSSSVFNNTSGQGSGIYNIGGTVTISDSTIISNTASSTSSGGGIYSYNGTLTISGSEIVSNTSGQSGGGIYSQSTTLTISNTNVLSNTAGAADIRCGGGIYSYEGTLAIYNSTLSGNTAGTGGGICGYSESMTIEGTTVRSNRAVASSNAKAGGILNGSDTASITNVTISGNTSNSTSGGIHNQEPMTLTNVTISGNVAPSGGALLNTGAFPLNIRSSTIANNTVPSGSLSGGIVNYGTITFQNTILANNQNSNCDNYGSLTSSGYSLDSGSTCGFGSASGNLSNYNPNLGPLQDNGGKTFTHALPGPAGSNLAIDRGGVCPATDQRGMIRFGLCDIGAYEFEQWLYVYLPIVLK